MTCTRLPVSTDSNQRRRASCSVIGQGPHETPTQRRSCFVHRNFYNTWSCRADWLSVAGESSDDVERWILVRKYRMDARAEMNIYMIDIVDDLYQRATDFMHQGGLRMEKDNVGKLHYIYLCCYISESKTACVWGCPMRFTSGCCDGLRITENGRYYMTLEFCGKHYPRCHEELLTNGQNSARRGMGFMPDLRSEDGTDDVGSCKHHVHFITCSAIP